MKFHHKYNRALTLVEVAIAAFVFLITIAGVLAGFVGFMRINENSRNFAQVNFCARQRIEDIVRQHYPEQISAYTSPTTTVFTTPDPDVCPHCPTGIGELKITPVTLFPWASRMTVLVDVRLVICWREVDGRIIGEAVPDTAGTVGGLRLVDLNHNGQIDSPVEIRTSITPF